MLEVIRMSLHIIAACVWVGGQLVLAGLVPTLRGLGEEAPRVVAQQFRRIAWPAFGVLILTGLWNAADWSGEDANHGREPLLGLKIGVVLLSGVAAYLHERAKERQAIAVWGAVSGVAALATLVVGVVLRG